MDFCLEKPEGVISIEVTDSQAKEGVVKVTIIFIFIVIVNTMIIIIFSLRPITDCWLSLLVGQSLPPYTGLWTLMGLAGTLMVMIMVLMVLLITKMTLMLMIMVWLLS